MLCPGLLNIGKLEMKWKLQQRKKEKLPSLSKVLDPNEITLAQLLAYLGSLKKLKNKCFDQPSIFWTIPSFILLCLYKWHTLDIKNVGKYKELVKE